MRVLHVTPSYLPAVRYGGPVFAVHGLCRALVRAGHAVDVFTTRADGAHDLDVVPRRRVDMDGVGVHYFDVRAPRRWYRSPGLAAALAARTAHYDLLHVHALFLHPVSAAAAAARRAGVPYVLSPRGMLVRELFARRSPLAKRCWMAVLGNRVLAHAAALHVTSDAEARAAGAFGLALPPLLNVPNGVDAVSGDCASGQRDGVLFLGRLSWKKGIERVLRALACLPRVRLTVAGNDDEGMTPALADLAAALGVADRVRFEGPVDSRRRDELMRRAAVFVLASLSENFANSVLEAMAARCPVVVTPEVGLADAVRAHGCGLVCDGEPRALAAALRAVLADPTRASAMGAAGRALVERRFLWATAAADMAEGYRTLAHAGPRTA